MKKRRKREWKWNRISEDEFMGRDVIIPEGYPKVLKKDKNGVVILPDVILSDFGFQMMFGMTPPQRPSNSRIHKYDYEI